MPGVGILILLVVGATVLCVKTRAAGAAAWFAALSVLFIVSTPVGSVLPAAVSGLFSFLDSITSPALNHGDAGGPASGAAAVSTGSKVAR